MLKEKAIFRVCYQSCKYTDGTTNLIWYIEHNHGINLKNDSDTKPMFGSKVKESHFKPGTTTTCKEKHFRFGPEGISDKEM